MRTAKGLTQAELGELLSYSDKSVSKWERAEAVPDAYVLKKMSEIFGVTVDYLLNSHDEWIPPKDSYRSFNSGVITAISIFGILTAALLIYIIGWILGYNWWLLFVYAVPIALITHLVLNSVWRKGKNNLFIVCALVASILLTVYLTLIELNMWQLLLLVIPAELITVLAFKVKIRRK